MVLKSLRPNFSLKNVLEELNALPLSEKKKYISQNDINIRQSIGEAVPTEIFRQIAENIRKEELK